MPCSDRRCEGPSAARAGHRGPSGNGHGPGVFLVPLDGAAAALLWRRSPWGYVLGAISVIAALLHQVSYVLAMPLQVAADVPGAASPTPGNQSSSRCTSSEPCCCSARSGPARPADEAPAMTRTETHLQPPDRLGRQGDTPPGPALCSRGCRTRPRCHRAGCQGAARSGVPVVAGCRGVRRPRRRARAHAHPEPGPHWRSRGGHLDGDRRLDGLGSPPPPMGAWPGGAVGILLLLCGGGFGPPVFRLVAGLLAIRARRPLSTPARPAARVVARLWPWPLVMGVTSFVLLFPGSRSSTPPRARSCRKWSGC